jgi:2-keto-4-pentenoate hydratase/2-oxohepta-3-ene-1,7-dioic acid hydratase in catechol pathway
MKILAVGMNYAEHNKELQHTLIQQEPVIFSKPDSALIPKGRPFFVPDFAQRFDYETEIVVRIDRLGKDISERFAHRYYSQLTVGIDFTARDLQQRLREQGLPWDICKGFDGAAAVGRFIDKTQLPPVDDIHFHMDLNGTTVQQGHTADMLHSIDRIVSYCSRFFTLKMGDLIFTGTPQGIGPVHENDTLQAWIENEPVLQLRVK